MTDWRFGVVVALVVVSSLAGCTASGSPEPERTHGLDETGQVRDDNHTFAVTVEEYRLVESYEVPGAGTETRTVTAPDGEQYLFVRITVENVGDGPGYPPEPRVRPTVEYQRGSEPVWMDEGWYEYGSLTTEPLEPGERRTGWQKRLVPENASADEFRLAFSTDMAHGNDRYRWTLDDE